MDKWNENLNIRVKLGSDANVSLPRLQCKVNGLNVNALVDTASTANFVSSKMNEKMLNQGALVRKCDHSKT